MARSKINERELNDSIFQPQKHKPVENTRMTSNVTAYTTDLNKDHVVDGFFTIDDVDSKFAYAKNDGNRFYIKSNGSQLADPFGLYQNDIYRKIGDEDVWRWRSVSPKVFTYYTTYLKTKNKSYFHNASREMF